MNTVNTSLIINGHRVVSLAFENLAIQPGMSVHRAMLPVRLHPVESFAGTLIDATCVVHLRDPGRRWLGDGRFEAPTQLATFDTPENFYFPLTDEQINVIEAQHNTGTLFLDLQVRARAVLTDGREFSVHASDTVLTITREQWLTQIANLSRGSWLAVGLVSPGLLGALASIAGHLRDAKRLLEAREYPSSATASRKALEAFRAAFIPANVPDERSIITGNKSAERPYEHRLLMAFYSAWSLACLAPHDDPEAARFTWTRESALSLLAAVTTLADQVAGGAWPTTFPAVEPPAVKVRRDSAGGDDAEADPPGHS
jgi:hypothetical protein